MTTDGFSLRDSTAAPSAHLPWRKAPGAAPQAHEGSVGYFGCYRNLRMTRDSNGILVVRLGASCGSIALAKQDYVEFEDAFGRIRRDPGNQVVIITGARGNFTPGPGPSVVPSDLGADIGYASSDLGSLLRAVASVSVPVIIAVEGRAHSHPEIALMADVVIAGAGATFSRSAPGSLSDIDLVRGLWRHRIGSDRADAFLIHPLPLSADRAWAWGLVDEVTATGGALARARAVARLYLAAPETTRRRLRSEVIEPLKERISPEWQSDWRPPIGRDFALASAPAA